MTRDYFLHGVTIVNGVRLSLPGVFEHNPFTTTVNTPLWTLPLEWRMYEYLALGWAVFLLAPRYRTGALRLLVPIVVLILFAINLGGLVARQRLDLGILNAYMFFAGSTFWLCATKLPLSFRILPPLFVAVVVAVHDFNHFFFLYLLALPPLVLGLAYAPAPSLLRFNRFGDYSYGVYIYGFPIQQTFAALRPDLSWVALTAYASLLTLPAAILSWRFVECPTLARKEAVTSATKRKFKAFLVATGLVHAQAEKSSPLPADEK